jgi:rhomboid protease GluP
MIPVRFEPAFSVGGSAAALRNSFRLRGKGEVGIVGGHLLVRGRRSVLFGIGKDVELAFSPEQIFDVRYSGREVRFMVRPSGSGRNGFISVFAASDSAAAALAALLPRTRSVQFEQEQRDLVEFQDKVKELAPRVWVTPTLVAINILVFVAMALAGAGVFTPNPQVHIRWGSNFGPLTTDHQWWRLFTCMFLHFGIVHLALNMWALYDIGRAAERLYGSAHFLLLYLLAGLAGSISSLLWNPMVNSAGASGAIFGVFGGVLAYTMNSANGVPVTIVNQHRSSTLVFIVYSLFYGFSHTGIDNAAHIGGLLGGFAAGLLLARPFDAEHRQAVGARLPATLVVGMAVLALMTLPVKNVGASYKKDEQYRTDLKWFVDEEKRLVAVAQKWRDSVKASAQPPAQLADNLERDVVEPWTQAHSRIAAHELDASSKLQEQRQLMLSYIASRRDGWHLVAEGVRTDNVLTVKEAQAKFMTGDTIMFKLNALGAKH